MQRFIDIKDSSKSWSLSEKTLGDGQKVLKVPVAILGSWKHPEYGQVEFSQQDFDQTIQNWQEARAGYDPPLFLGHPLNTNVMEGDPSEGWPDKVYQEDQVLYADYIPTSAELYSDVENKRYRYASAEIIRNARDKETGENIGSLLVGVALTNRPFLPLKDQTVEVVQRFSDPSDTSVGPPALFVFDLQPSNGNLTMETVTTQEPVKQDFSEPSTTTSTIPAEPALPTVSKVEYDKLAEQFSKLATDYSELKQMFSEMRTREKDKEVAQKLSKLEALNLPASTKETFSEMIKGGTLSPEAEDKLFSSYQQLSDTYGAKYTQEQGEADKNTQADNKVELPQLYADIIERNKRIAEARATQTQRFI